MSSNANTPHRLSRRRLYRSSGLHRILPPASNPHYPQNVLPLQTPEFQDRIEALAESMGEFSENMTKLSHLNNAVCHGFNEPFAAFLYGLTSTMFCNDIPNRPTQFLYYQNSSESTAVKRVENLREQVRLARAENKRLKDQAAATAQGFRALPRRNELFQSRRVPAKARTVAFSGSSGPARKVRKINVAHDDTYSTNDSFVDAPASKIPQRARTAQGEAPNLNQPPRYMHGLFDKTQQANIARSRSKSLATGPTASSARRATRKPPSLASRPPFR